MAVLIATVAAAVAVVQVGRQDTAAPPSRAISVTAPAGLDEVDTLRGVLREDASPPQPRAGALKAMVDGGANAYARGRLDVAWHEGDVVSFGAAFLLPRGFAAGLAGQVDLLRWDDYPSTPVGTHRSGVVLFAGDGRAHLIRQRLGIEETPIARAFDLPEGRWFRLEVRQRLDPGDGASSEVLIDDRVVATSPAPNTYGNAVQRVRFGLVAIDASRQRDGLTLWFARPFANPG